MHGESSLVRPGGRGRRNPEDTQREGVDQSAAEGETRVSLLASASWRPGAQFGPQTSMPYSRTGQVIEWMMRSLAATPIRRDTSTGCQA
jgi:hypothetical protein